MLKWLSRLFGKARLHPELEEAIKVRAAATRDHGITAMQQHAAALRLKRVLDQERDIAIRRLKGR